MKQILAVLLVCCMLFGLAACHIVETMPDTPEELIGSESNSEGKVENLSASQSGTDFSPQGEYNEGVVLVKVEDTFADADLGELAYTSAEALYDGSQWYLVALEDTTAQEAVEYLAQLDTVTDVDYDYVMAVTAKEEENPKYNEQVNLGLSNIPHGWTVNGKAPGGSPDVVVAVIDTGVDYTHLDLRNNIWVNTAEIPGNGKDDDGNGYIDDINGWDCVGNDNDPMDDNGHGTHVAGIIAAENNKEGGIGVAYNCKVMVLKAGNSSGYFNNSDIAEAIQYAYMNGASVINMSFGGANIAIAVEEALENAYNSCVLVAAAGNDGACNNLSCKECDTVGVCYPAALPYVIGVMSTDKDGKHLSSFSNYDHYPYDSIEYEVYAVGEGVGSTWPSNKYACLNGTSMAAPTVSGIAALLRSDYTDREVYSTKFIQSQIVNTGTVNPHILDHETDEAHSVADVLEALTKLPKPAVNLYDCHIDDSVSISNKNNGNGVIDAGETVRLYISLHNRGGAASNVNVSIDTYRSQVGDEALTDPYFAFVNPTMQLSDIGTYSVRESGDKYFEIIVSPDCPNDYLVNFNIRFTYTNGLDTEDKTVYEDDGKQKAQFNVSSGYHLPGIINEDTVYEADKLYIVGENVIIPAGVTVTFKEGCQIQFYDDREYYSSPKILVYGALKVVGTAENLVCIAPNERHSRFACTIAGYGNGTIDIQYADTYNLCVTEVDSGGNYSNTTVHTQVRNTAIRIMDRETLRVNDYEGGKEEGTYMPTVTDLVDNCFVELIEWNSALHNADIRNSFVLITARNSTRISFLQNLTNNIVVTTWLCNSNSSTEAVGFAQNATVTNNIFMTARDDVAYLHPFRFGARSTVSNNTFSDLYKQYEYQILEGRLDSSGNPILDINDTCSDTGILWPHVVSIEMFNKDGELITTIGKEEITVRVTFNRPMAQREDTYLTFGTIEPYADYRIDGQWVDELVWEGTYTLKAQIENGQNYLKVVNACAAEDPTKTVFGEYQLHEFTIDTTAAMSMNLQAVAKENGIALTFAQDDYDTLLGYNIYRSEDKNGNFVKLNPTILLPDENTFLDDNAEPGKTYWYTYTVVLSDFTESSPAGMVQATATDTMSPSLYHTPVNQGYENNNLVISCTASDNVGIDTVTLYYRAVGATAWKSIVMSKQNDKFNATIFGSEVTLAGLQYYIVAADSRNTVNKGSAEAPYTVVVKSADSLLGKGDVDGDGAITTKDALMMMQRMKGELILQDDQFKRGDLNGDGVFSAVEILQILRYINGNATDLNV